MKELEIIDTIYKALVANKAKYGIPIHLGVRATVGTVQDDPFDRWICAEITAALPKSVEVFHSGSLTTPDLVIRDPVSGIWWGLEIKTLIQKPNGRDSRGMTIDYNSSLPCGSTMIKVGKDTVIIPCYYIFALLDNASRYIVSLIIADGDFLNYDFDLYKRRSMQITRNMVMGHMRKVRFGIVECTPIPIHLTREFLPFIYG